MTHRLAKLITTAAVLTAAGAARANGGWEHAPPAPPAGGDTPGAAETRTALFLAKAADADSSGDVTAAEWDTFIASLNADANGVIDINALIAALPLPVLQKHGGGDDGDDEDDNDDDDNEGGTSGTGGTGGLAGLFTRVFDLDRDGKVETSDLNAFFAFLDTNGDGDLSAAEIDAAAQELAPPPVLEPDPNKAALILARAADADKSGDVTATEWADFKASLHPDANGVIDVDALLAALPKPAALKHGSQGAANDGGGLAEFFIAVYDHDGDGQIETSDLDAFFATLDTDGDGALSASELPPPPMVALRRVPERALRLLARAADTDRKYGISAAEVAAFADGLVAYPATGAVDLGDLATKLRLRGAAVAGPARRKALLVKLFDVDRDGVVTLSDLHTILSALDINGDGTIQKRELLRARRLRR